MKKILSLTLVLAMVLTVLAGCGGNAAPETTAPAVPETNAPETTAPAVTAPSALEVLENTWAAYAEDEKFAVIGGSMAAPVDGAPGSYDIADENISYNLLIPAEQLANITEVASMMHMMNANTFTGAAYTVADTASVADFTAAMKDAIMNNQWICGFPEELLMGTLGNCVVVAFGAADLMDVFETHLRGAYADFEITVEPLM